MYLYEGDLRIVKPGPQHLLKRQGEVEIIRSATLPIGVLQEY